MRRNDRQIAHIASLSLFILILMYWSAVNAAAAQDLVGNISGAVAASSGARLQDVQVHITNTQTGLDRTVKTNDKGEYNLFGLPIGTYSVTFTKTGFKSEVHSQIAVTAGATTTVSVALQVGSVETSIDVVATPLLNRADTTNGYALESSTIEAVPLGTGSFTQLAVLTPGVSADVLTGSGTNAGLGNQAIWANGQRSTSNSFSFNGVNSDNLFNGTSSSAVGEAQFLPNTGEVFLPGGLIQTNTSVYDAIGEGLPTPPPETIEEMKVDASMYDASEGASSGAHISVITKSGTNDLHGQLYWYTQNSAFNAAPFFYNASSAIPAGQKVPELQRNTYGFTLGGPLIPNKLLYFVSYQGTVDHDQLSGTSKLNVPLALTNNRSAGALEQEFNVNSIDPVALNLLNAQVNGQYLIPTPSITTAAQAASLGYDAIITGKPDFYTNQLNYNVDYNVSAIDRMSLKYYYQEDPTVSPFATSSLSGFPQTLTAGGQVFSLQNSRILSSTMTWEQSLGFTRQVAFANVQQAIAPSQEGVNLYGALLFPKITISQADPTLKKSLAFGAGSNFSNGGVFQNEYTYDTSLYWVVGSHTFESGFHFSRSQLNVVNNSNQAASFTVSNWANFLAGTIKSGQVLQGSTNRYYRANTSSVFAQDNWKVTPRLNVNYGLRWDYDGPLSELHGLLDNFDPSLYSYNPTTDTVTNDGLVVAGNNPQYATQGVSASTLTQHQWGFAPRLGITWSPMANNNFVIRAGGGIYYDRGEFFTEFSPGAGSGISGPLGVTQELPFVQVFKSPGGSTLDSPLGAC